MNQNTRGTNGVFLWTCGVFLIPGCLVVCLFLKKEIKGHRARFSSISGHIRVAEFSATQWKSTFTHINKIKIQL